MTGDPLVSVVIPTYNHARFLGEALRSVRAQRFTSWEAIVVNNHSTDETVQVVASFGDARIRLENFHNHGVIAASRNRGIALARGEFVAFLDSDDAWDPEKLSRCVARLNEGFDLVGHGVRWVGGRSRRSVFSGPARRASFRQLVYRGNCFITSATIVRTRLLDEARGFSEDPAIVTAEDYHLWIRLVRAGARVSFLREVLGTYCFHSGNQSGALLRHINATQRVIDEFVPAERERGLIDRLLIRRRSGILQYGVARSLQQNGEFASSWPWLLRAARVWPFFPRIYATAALVGLRRTAKS